MKRLLLIVFILTVMTVAATSVQALTVTDLVVELGCTSWSYNTYTYTLNRDNTGSGREAFYIEAVDGNGTLVHRHPRTGVVSLPLGSGSESGRTVSYNITNPSADPITYRWVSIAGNGYEEQIAYSTTQSPGCGVTPTDPPPTPTDPPPTPTDPPPTPTDPPPTPTDPPPTPTDPPPTPTDPSPTPTDPPPTPTDPPPTPTDPPPTPTDPPPTPTDPPPTPTDPPPTPTDPPPTLIPTATPTPSPFSTPVPEEGQFNPGDLRLNRSDKDRAAPVAIYCMAHGIQVRIIDDAGRGIDPPAINIFFEEIEADGIPSERHLLLAEAQGVQLWRLTDGSFQVNTTYRNEPGKAYVVSWDDCPYSRVITLEA